MIKVSEIIEQHKQGNVPLSTLIKMAAFKNELEKTAVGADLFGKIYEGAKATAPAILTGATTMGLGALIFEGVRGLEKRWQGYRLDSIKEPKFLDMLDIHPELKADKKTGDLARLYFDSLWHFSPSMAQDPLAAGAYIKQALQMHHNAQGPIPAQVQQITEVQKNISQGSSKDEYATPMGAMFLSFKPHAGAAPWPSYKDLSTGPEPKVSK